MISPETFYEMNLKGKTPEQIMTVIRGLKREIGRLKNIMEHPDYSTKTIIMCPTESTQISLSRWYLERAKLALQETGGTYAPSAAEKKALDFDDNIPFINKIVFQIGGFFDGYKNRAYIIDGDKLNINKEFSYMPKPCDTENGVTDELNKDIFLDSLKDLHIGEWRKHYDLKRYGRFKMDGIRWKLEIYFSNGHRAIKIDGDNAYPYNFDQLLELFEIEE